MAPTLCKPGDAHEAAFPEEVVQHLRIWAIAEVAWGLCMRGVVSPLVAC
jgi:hypothetical protein